MTDGLTLTQHDQAVRAAIDAMVAWGDACCMKCLAAEAKIDDVVRAAEARGVWLARERLAVVLAQRDANPPTAWMYRGKPWYDGNRWHDEWCVTLDERLARDKSGHKEPIPLYERTTTTEGGQGDE